MTPKASSAGKLLTFGDADASTTRFEAGLLGAPLRSTAIGRDQIEGNPGAPLPERPIGCESFAAAQESRACGSN
jgi:hypothetical protein